MSRFDELQAEHQRLLEQRDAGGDEQALVQAAQAYIEKVQAGAEQVSDSRERGQLKANLRFWGAYIYEKTRVYPDTTLRPAAIPAIPGGEPEPPPTGAQPVFPPVAVAKQPASPRPKAGSPIRWAMILPVAAVLVLVGVCIGLFEIFKLPRLNTFPAAQVPTSTPAAAALPSTRTPPPTSAPAPAKDTPNARTATFDARMTQAIPSKTPAPRTATVEALMTLATDGGNASASPTYTPIPQIPVSGGGGSMVDVVTFRARVATVQPPQDCAGSANTLTLDFSGFITQTLDFLGPNPGFRMEPITVRVSQAGSGRLVAPPQALPWDSRTAQDPLLRLQTGAGDQTLLVQVDQPRLLFETVIVQFLGDCRRSQVSIAYSRDQQGPDLQVLRSSLGPPAGGLLSVNWVLVTWGPLGSTGAWIARLNLQGVGGDGNYIFYSPENNELIEGQLNVAGMLCASAERSVAVISNGQSAVRFLSLAAPCDRQATPTPVP